MPPPTPPPVPDRFRLSLDLSTPVMLSLDHVSAVTGVPKATLAARAIVAALPALLAEAEAIAGTARRVIEAEVKRQDKPGRKA